MRNKLKQWLSYLLVFTVGLNLGLGILFLSNKFEVPKQWPWEKKTENVIKANSGSVDIYEEINPPGGYAIKTTYGSLGPMMLKSGVIDIAKFKQAYEKSGQPLTEEQLAILENGSEQKIIITPENSRFLLNFFWAVGLANQSKILTEGEMVDYGGIKEAGNFASTGGWTLSKNNAMNYYSKAQLIPLTTEQEALVETVAGQIFRPCCNNPTSFPDCNHGMALLGLLELMASQGSSENEMFEASKYVNAYWFPGSYYDLAVYFKNKENKSFAQVDARRLLSKEFSSASGAQAVKQWLVNKGVVAEPPKTGGGCGV